MPAPFASPTDLCTACGLCCGGALFDFGPLAPEEVDQAHQDGMAVLTADNTVCFGQPCPALDGALCTIYATRPATCRNYRCQLLRALDTGNVTIEAALTIVESAQATAREVIAQLPAGESIPDARRRRREAAASDGQAMMIAPPGLMIALGMLDVVLDQHFRKPSERQVMPRD